MTLVAALCVRHDSVYKGLPGVVAYDAQRDARTFRGGMPVVAHPPCGQWGRLRRFAAWNEAEKALGPWAVRMVRGCGGVLEHPAWSTLWTACDLPLPGRGPDTSGGWTLSVQQFWWGHPAAKATWLYIVGCGPRDVPPCPLPAQAEPDFCVTHSRREGRSPPEMPKGQRDVTPALMAEWLVELARECDPDRQRGRATA